MSTVKSSPFQQTMVKLHVPEHMGTSFAIGGFEIEADSDRTVEVPKHLAPVLKEHGLTDYVAPEPKKAK